MSEFDPNRIYHALVTAGEEWADKEAAASLLEETKKTVLAELMNQSKATSQAAKEAEALGDSAYRDHINTMVRARKEANKAKIRYQGQIALADMRRSQEATRRAEMKL